jgi:hypothetical protein
MEAIGYFCSSDSLCCCRMLIMSVLDFTYSKIAGFYKVSPSRAGMRLVQPEVTEGTPLRGWAKGAITLLVTDSGGSPLY